MQNKFKENVMQEGFEESAMQDRFELFTKGITAIYRSVQKIKHMEMTEFGLKGMHVMCLRALYKTPQGLTAAQLCEACAEDKAAISRSIATLKEEGFVTESQDDAQKKYRSIIRLTKAGEELAVRESEKIERALNAGGKGLSDDDRERFYAGLYLISENLENYIKQIEGAKQ